MTLPTNIEETAAWLGRELTENESSLFDFCTPFYRQAQDEKVLSYHAWFECDADMLDTPIPQEALDAFFGTSTDEEGVTTSNVTNMTLRDFTFSVELSLDGTTAICRAGAKHGVTYRKERVTADDLADWMVYLNAYEYTDDDLLTIEQHAEKLASPEYSTGDEL